jgi:putative hemolysin
MRRALEAALVVIVLVAVPVGVGIVARSEPSPGPPQGTALAVMQPILTLTRLTPARCEWTHNHANINCTLRGGGSCNFSPREQSGRCSQPGSGSAEEFRWAQKTP